MEALYFLVLLAIMFFCFAVLAGLYYFTKPASRRISYPFDGFHSSEEDVENMPPTCEDSLSSLPPPYSPRRIFWMTNVKNGMDYPDPPPPYPGSPAHEKKSSQICSSNNDDVVIYVISKEVLEQMKDSKLCINHI